MQEITQLTEQPKVTPASKARPALVILNCGAGTDNKESMPEKLARVFEERKFDARIEVITPDLDLRKTIAEELKQGCKLIIAGGGDGTINAVAEHLLECSATFGVLPLGTLNHFAKDLGIPMDLEQAVDTVIAGFTTVVDAGEVNGKLFLNNSSLGLYPQLVRDREAQQKHGRTKWVAFAKSLVTVMYHYNYFRVHLVVEGKEITRRTPLVFVGNNRYKVDGLNLGSRESLKDGVLCAYIPHSVGRFGLVWLSLRAIVGKLRDADTFDEYVASEFTIDTRTFKRLRWLHRKRLQQVAVDGEVTILEKPLQYKSLNKILRVIVPEQPEPADDLKNAKK